VVFVIRNILLLAPRSAVKKIMHKVPLSDQLHVFHAVSLHATGEVQWIL